MLRAANLATSIHPLKTPSSLEIQSRYRARQQPIDAGTLVVTVELEFEGRATATDAEAEAPPAIRLEATFELAYNLKPEAEYPEGALDDFSRLNGAYNVWPYWRELVQSVTGRVGLAGIIIPVFRASDFELRFKGITDDTRSEPQRGAKPSAPRKKLPSAAPPPHQ